MYRLIFSLLLISLLFSCKKEEPSPEPSISESGLNNGLLVLNEGLFQQNNSRLSWVNRESGEVNNEFFEQTVGRPLGDTGNDMMRYGSKIYVVVNVSSTIEILDANTGQSLKQISMQANGQAKQPRSLALAAGKVYVSCYDGFVDVLDTNSLEITSRIPVGSNPDQVATVGDYVLVSNSGGLNFPDLDSTISIINTASDSEISRLTVGLNPGSIIAGEEGFCFVYTRGDYADVEPKTVKLDLNSFSVVATYNDAISGFERMKDELLVLRLQGESYVIDKRSVSDFSLLESAWLNLENVDTPYNLQFIPGANKLIISDAKNYTTSGNVHVYSSSGTKEATYKVSINPQAVIYYE